MQVTDAPTIARYGKVLAGPEYFTIFDGRTGAALATTDYVPGREPQDGWGGIGGNGGTDNNGNRVDRFLAGVAYLDGRLPSVIMARGYYGRTVLAAWDWRNGQLTSRWVFDSGSGRPTVSESHGVAVLGPGQSQPLGCRRRWRRPGRDHLRRDGRRRRRQGAVLDGPAPRRRAARRRPRSGPARASRCSASTRTRKPDRRARARRASRLRRAHRPDSLEPAARRRRRPRAGRRHRSAPSRRRILGRNTPVGLLDAPGHSASPTRRSSVNFAVWWDADPLRELLDGNWIGKWDWNTSALRQAAHRDRRRVEQRHQGHAGALGRHPRRLARGSDLARRRQRVAANLHDDHPRREPPLHADARSAVPRRRSRGRTSATTSRRIPASSSATA